MYVEQHKMTIIEIGVRKFVSCYPLSFLHPSLELVPHIHAHAPLDACTCVRTKQYKLVTYDLTTPPTPPLLLNTCT